MSSARQETAPKFSTLPKTRDFIFRKKRLALSFAGDLSSELARHTEFRLVSRHSAFALRGQNLSTREICERLDVKYFVGGQVQFSEDGLRWSIELVNGFDDQVVWSEHNAVQYADMNLAKDELTWRIACSIHDILRRSARSRALSRPPDSLDAYETTQIVLATMAKTSISATRDSQRLAAAAVKKFPLYPRAWTALANTHLWDTMHAHTGQWHEGRAAQILEEIQKAIALDPSQAYAFAILAGTLALNGQYGRVEMWRGGSRSGMSVAAPFVWRCPSNFAVAIAIRT